MYRSFLIATAIALPTPTAFAFAAAPAPLDTVSAHLRAVTTMTADFSQTGRNGGAVSGKLLLKRPGRIRFEYQPSAKLLVVGDGKALTMIDYSVRQVSRWPIGNSPLSVLLNANQDLSRFARRLPTPDDAMVLIEARDPKHPEFGTITIAFSKRPDAPAGLVLDGWTVLDAQNNRSTVRLSNQRFNTPIADTAFRWTDPRPRGPRG